MIPVKKKIAEGAALGSLEAYRALYRESIEDPAGFWRRQAERVTWFHPPHEAGSWDYDAVDFSWYEGGKINACHNAIDRHLLTQPDKTAILWA
ncbi:MAG: acetyl-coenzyme A synthetase N-terminal domain-containing protein, partial [Acidobacteriota bacterium]